MLLKNDVVKKPGMLNSLSYDKILITPMFSKHIVLEKILQQGIPRSKLVMLE